MRMPWVPSKLGPSPVSGPDQADFFNVRAPKSGDQPVGEQIGERLKAKSPIASAGAAFKVTF